MITVRAWRKYFEESRHVTLTIKGGRVSVPHGTLSDADKIILGAAKSQLLGDLGAPLSIQRTRAECEALGLVEIQTSEVYSRRGDLTTTSGWTHVEGDLEALRILCGDISFEDARNHAKDRTHRARTMEHHHRRHQS